MATLDEKGHEILDDTPVAIPAKFMRQPTLTDQVRALIHETSHRAAEKGMETLEEANDFDIPDEYDPASIHEESVAMELDQYVKDFARNQGWVDPTQRPSTEGGNQTDGGIQQTRKETPADPAGNNPD